MNVQIVYRLFQIPLKGGHEKRTCSRNYLLYFIEEEIYTQKGYLGPALSSRNIIQAVYII